VHFRHAGEQRALLRRDVRPHAGKVLLPGGVAVDAHDPTRELLASNEAGDRKRRYAGTKFDDRLPIVDEDVVADREDALERHRRPGHGQKPVIAEQILQQQKASRFVVVADDGLNPPAEGTECTLKHWAESSPGFGLSMRGASIIMSDHRPNKQIQ
jgi:hypothetical protein